MLVYYINNLMMSINLDFTNFIKYAINFNQFYNNIYLTIKLHISHHTGCINYQCAIVCTDSNRWFDERICF